ncbi:(d)CMP kinase [Candidatus Woesebacteria bacterium]|nr:(d)CMP kinase [Candidatus Woesebacteria bacterium]
MNNISIAEIYQIKQPYSGQSITISGPSAVGKSTIGKAVADKINVPFYDLDDEVSTTAGFATTQEVIQTLGHNEFKIIQQRCLQKITQTIAGRYVLACGGEIQRPGYDRQIISDNRSLITKHTYNICLFPSTELDESVEVLFPRLNDGKRDTGTTGKTVEVFRTYIDVFSQYSDLADSIVLTHRASVHDVVSNVLKVLST